MLFFFKQKTAYEMRISDWSSDVCSSDLTGKGTIGELGQLAIITRREVQPHFANLPLDEMEIVDQPFRGRGDRGLAVHRRADQAIGVDQARFVGRQAVEQGMAQLPVRLDGLGERQASRMLLHSLDAEERFANGRRVVPRRLCGRALESPDRKSTRLNSSH